MNYTTKQPDIIGAILTEVRTALGGIAFSADTEAAIEARMRLAFGGQEVYIKKSRGVPADDRALAIRTRYNMCNRRELQAEFGISRGQFYKILKGG